MQKYEEKISCTGSRKQNKIREMIPVEIADATTEFITKKIKIQPMEQWWQV